LFLCQERVQVVDTRYRVAAVAYDDVAPRGQKRASRVSRIEGCIGLDDVIDQPLVIRLV
jgi:hypothetical protein